MLTRLVMMVMLAKMAAIPVVVVSIVSSLLKIAFIYPAGGGLGEPSPGLSHSRKKNEKDQPSASALYWVTNRSYFGFLIAGLLWSSSRKWDTSTIWI